MRFAKALFLSICILVCPLAFCHGQLSFYGVNGEKGYAALRGTYTLDLDNGFIITPNYGYYRRSDKEEDEAGSTSRYGLTAEYWLNDDWAVGAGGRYIPLTLGFENTSWFAQGKWLPFYRYGVLKNPVLKLTVGQSYYHIYDDIYSAPLPDRFASTETNASFSAASDAGAFNVQVLYHKVIKYSSRPGKNVSSNWADIPFMTAVVQGFVQEAAAARLAYRTEYLTPYVSWSRYSYAEAGGVASAVSAGVNLHLGEVSLSGGVEVFEPRREANRKTYFSMSADMEF